jgi:hypothetical protein
MLEAAGVSALVVAAGPMGTEMAHDRSRPGGRGDLTFEPVQQNVADRRPQRPFPRPSVVGTCFPSAAACRQWP